MKKIKNDSLSSFIQRYNLNKLIEKAVISCENGVLKCDVSTPDKSNIVYIKQENCTLPDFKIGVMTSSELLSLLKIVSEDLEIEFKENSNNWIHQIIVTDGDTNFVYNTSSLDVFDNAPEIDELPEFETEILINAELIGNFIKSSDILNAEYFVVNSSGKKTEFVINYNKIKANTITFPVSTKDDKHFKTKNELILKTDFLKQIFLANKSFEEATLQISTEGLARLYFKSGELSIEYYCLLSELNS